jgi:hypothetical protein
VGNENGVNQTSAIYSFNVSYYYGSDTRYARLIQINRNTISNSYGDIYAYFGAYSASYTAGDQSVSGTALSTLNVYFRNAVGAGCNASYYLIQTNY